VVAVVAALGLAACGSSSHSSTAGTPTPTTTPSAATASTAAASTGTTTPASGSSSADLATFKADVVKAKQSGSALGPQLSSTLQKAGKMTDAELVQRFGQLAQKVNTYADSVSHFNAPPQVQARYQLVVTGFHALASDLANIAKLGAEHEGTAQGKVAVEKLYADLKGLSQAETDLDKAVGLPN
jgi:hypothetical protein